MVNRPVEWPEAEASCCVCHTNKVGWGHFFFNIAHTGLMAKHCLRHTRFCIGKLFTQLILGMIISLCVDCNLPT